MQQHKIDFVDLDYNYLHSLKENKKTKVICFSNRNLFFLIPRYGLSGTALSNAVVILSVVCAAQGIPPGLEPGPVLS